MRAAAFQEHHPSFRAELPPAQLHLCRTFVGDAGRARCLQQWGGFKNDPGSSCGAGKCLLGEWRRFLLFPSLSSSPALRSWRCWTAPLLQGHCPRTTLPSSQRPPSPAGGKNPGKNHSQSICAGIQEGMFCRNCVPWVVGSSCFQLRLFLPLIRSGSLTLEEETPSHQKKKKIKGH